MNGITPQKLERFRAEATANQRRLEECSGPHLFEDLTPGRGHFGRARCIRCGGEVSSADRRWYELGLQHGAQRART